MTVSGKTGELQKSSRANSAITGYGDSARSRAFFPNVLVIVLVIAAYGPYLVGSIRTEQFVVYGLAPLLVASFIRLRAWTLGIMSSWFFMLVAVTIGYIYRYEGFVPGGSGSVLSGYDNVLLPLVVMLLIWTLVPLARAQGALVVASKVIVGMTVANAILAIVSISVPGVINFLQIFWVGGDGGTSVAERAMMMGRISGIFNQPAEAGLVYSIAAVLAVYVLSHRPGLMYILIGIITIGGLLSVSKIFILIGLPVSLVLLFKTQRISGRFGIVLAGSFMILFLGTAAFFQEWTGLDYLTRLLDVPADQSVFQFYTAGRWTEDSALLGLARFILSVSPLVGMGVGGLAVAYDSLWTEGLVLGGLLMVLALATVLIQLIAIFRRIQNRNLRLTAYAFWVVLVGASFGIPSLTANRAATLVWVVASLLVAVASSNRKQPAARRFADRSIGDATER